MKRLACLLLFAPLLLVPACDDDGTGPGGAYGVTLRVTDNAGAPAAGLDVALMNDGWYLQDVARVKARAVIPYQLAVPARAIVTVEDIEGGPVATLVDALRPAGPSEVAWNARDAEDANLPSGRYTVRLVVRDGESGALLFEDTRDVLLASGYGVCGTTDADGVLVLADKKLFPHLYERPPLRLVNEEGVDQGPFTLESTMRFYLWDPALPDVVHRHDAEVTADGGLIHVVLEPAPVAAAAPARESRVHGSAPGALPPAEFALGQPYPNPFN